MVGPPRLSARSESAEGGSVGWLELLQDLVVVAAVLVLFEGLVNGVVGLWWGWYAAALVAVYLLWLADVVVVNGFPGTSLARQIVSMIWMAGLVTAATGALWQNWQPEWVLCLGVAIVLASTATTYILTAVAQPHPVPVLWQAGTFLAAGAVIAAIAAISSTEVAQVLLPASIIVGVLIAPVFLARSLLDIDSLRAGHLSERFGQLVLIMLGESFLEIVIGVRQEEDFRPSLAIFAALVVFLLWRAYFLLLLPSGPPRTRGRLAAWIIAHGVLVVGFGFAAASAGRWATSDDMGFDTYGWASTGVAAISVGVAYLGIAAVAATVGGTRILGVYVVGALTLLATWLILGATGIEDPWSALPLAAVMIIVNLVATRRMMPARNREDVSPAP